MRAPEPSMTKPSLALRRKELIERCAEQRTGLAYELRALRPSAALADHPAIGAVIGYVATNRKLVMGVLGAGLGLTLFGRRRLAGLAGSAGAMLRAWTMVRGLLGTFRRGAR
jgi:hypothetical protein